MTERTTRPTALGRTTTRTDEELRAARVCLRALFVGDCPMTHRWTLIGSDDLPVTPTSRAYPDPFDEPRYGPGRCDTCGKAATTTRSEGGSIPDLTLCDADAAIFDRNTSGDPDSLTHGTYDPDDDSTKTPERGYGPDPDREPGEDEPDAHTECCGAPMSGPCYPGCVNADGMDEALAADIDERHAAYHAPTDETASHPDHDGLRARHLDHWTCDLCPVDPSDLPEGATLDDDLDELAAELIAAYELAIEPAWTMSAARAGAAGWVRYQAGEWWRVESFHVERAALFGIVPGALSAYAYEHGESDGMSGARGVELVNVWSGWMSQYHLRAGTDRYANGNRGWVGEWHADIETSEERYNLSPSGKWSTVGTLPPIYLAGFAEGMAGGIAAAIADMAAANRLPD